MSAINENLVKSLCKFGQGSATCAYLTKNNGWECTKGTPAETFISQRRETMQARGDNCSGPPYFKRTEPLQAEPPVFA
jgi:hypothetical protein